MADHGLAGHLFALERRRAERDVVNAACAMGLGGPARFTADLIDIWQGGCMVRTAAIASEGKAVRIGLPGLDEIDGQVVWAMGSRIGIAFEDLIAAEDYAVMLAAIG